MSFSTLERKDDLNKLDSYIHIYDTKALYLLKNQYRKNILRIIKKSILGTNFIYWYSKHSEFISAILNFIIINTCFVIFPQLFFHSVNIEQIIDDMQNQQESEESTKNISFFSKKSTDFIFRLFISNIINMIILAVITIKYKYKQTKINKYMEKYTQCSISPENNLIKDKFNCIISNDGKFNIEINLINNKNNYSINTYNNKHFFEYVINFPNVRFVSNYLYKKVFLPKEKEIINKIVAISNEIEFKYKKKLISFLLIIITILLCIPLIKYVSAEKRLDILNYFGIFALSLFVQRNIFLNNKNEQIKNISLLNNEYINDGYFIYINNDIISLFFLKEEYRNIDSIDKIKEMNQKFLFTYDLI